MKNWGIFLGGVGTGIVLTIVVLFLIGTYYINATPAGEENRNPNELAIGITDFEQIGDVIDEGSVMVFQVIDSNTALVFGEGHKNYKGEPYYHGPTYLIRNNEGKYYYDKEIIKRPSGKKFRQTGIYRYYYGAEIKTVPIIELR